MRFAAEDLLSALLEATPLPTVQAPRDARGLYGLVDHHGDMRYIGSTSSTDQTFYERIHQRHRTGSEGMSHYFSQMYNTGRMWRDRKDALTKADGDIAKALRNEFVVDHCRAVWLPLPDTADIARLEAEVLSLASDHAIAWNRRRMQAYDEPIDLVEATLRRLGWGARELAAIERQRLRFRSAMVGPVAAPAPKTAATRQTRVTPFWTQLEALIGRKPPQEIRIILTSTPGERIPEAAQKRSHIINVADVAGDPAKLAISPLVHGARVFPGQAQRRFPIDHSDDYGIVWLRSETLTFGSDKQRQLLGLLFNAYWSGSPECRTAVVLFEAGYGDSTNSFSKVFSGRDDWRSFIKYADGNCWIEP